MEHRRFTKAGGKRIMAIGRSVAMFRKKTLINAIAAECMLGREFALRSLAQNFQIFEEVVNEANKLYKLKMPWW